jgi:hypothetical protein
MLNASNFEPTAGAVRGVNATPNAGPNNDYDRKPDDYKEGGGVNSSMDTTLPLQGTHAATLVLSLDSTLGTHAPLTHGPNNDEKPKSTLKNHGSTQTTAMCDEANNDTIATAATSAPPDDCPICYEFFADPVTLQCSHSFCRACLLECTFLAPNGQSCPLCRQRLTLPDLLTAAGDEKLENQVQAIFLSFEIKALVMRTHKSLHPEICTCSHLG